MKATERCKILREQNNILKSLLLRIRRDLNFLRKEKYQSTIPITLIRARIEDINNTIQNTRGKS